MLYLSPITLHHHPEMTKVKLKVDLPVRWHDVQSSACGSQSTARSQSRRPTASPAPRSTWPRRCAPPEHSDERDPVTSQHENDDNDDDDVRDDVHDDAVVMMNMMMPKMLVVVDIMVSSTMKS